MTPTKSGPSCLIGTWSLYSLRQQDLFINNTVLVPVSYKSGSMRYTFSGNGTVAVRATNVRLGGTGADHHYYEALISATGSTSYTVHSNGTITYSDAVFAPGTFASYVDHVLQSTTSGNEWVGTTDTYTCVGNTFRISGTDNFGHPYAYSFSRLS